MCGRAEETQNNIFHKIKKIWMPKLIYLEFRYKILKSFLHAKRKIAINYLNNNI